MTDREPGGGARPFGAGELDGVSGIAPDELAGDAMAARELEALADRTRGGPTGDFVDRVMAAVAAEPMAAPARAAGIALRRGAFGAFLASLGDAWRVTTRPGFPMAVRAQALALVLLVAGLAAGSGLATAGAIGLLDDDRGGPPPHPSLVAPSVDTDVPSVVEPTPTATSEDTSPAPSQAVEPAQTEDNATAEPTHTAEPADTGDEGGDHHGGGASSGAGNPTQRPDRTPRPTPTHGDDSGDRHGGGGEDGSETPEPTETAEPGETPDGSSGTDSGSLSSDS